jgi:hypothetical protein
VVEQLRDIPAGTLGFRLSGRITRNEHFEILHPVREKPERGAKVSFQDHPGRDPRLRA